MRRIEEQRGAELSSPDQVGSLGDGPSVNEGDMVAVSGGVSVQLAEGGNAAGEGGGA